MVFLCTLLTFFVVISGYIFFFVLLLSVSVPVRRINTVQLVNLAENLSVCLYNSQIKIHQICTCMIVPYQWPNHQIQYAIWDPTAKFNISGYMVYAEWNLL